MRRITLPLLLCSVLVIWGCSNSVNIFAPPSDGDQDLIDPDKDTEVAETDLESEFDFDAPCTPGSAICMDAQRAIQCTDQGKWEVKEVCTTAQTCTAGRCEPPLLDGDGESEPEPVKCTNDSECYYGAGCDPSAAGADEEGCVFKSTCQSDANCQLGYKCVAQSNWKECIKTPDKCQSTDDCTAATEFGFGFVCKKGENGYNECIDTNQCKVDTDCTIVDQVCKKGPVNYVCQVDGTPCAAHSDCPYDYKCDTTLAVPVCVYASNCKVDKDCSALEACLGQSNWRSCQIDASLCKVDTDCKAGSTCVVLVAGQGYCKAQSCKTDSDCPADRYCAVAFGQTGSCKSRNECTLDSDCTDGKVCKDNGTYMTCQDRPSCTSDATCELGYKCLAAGGTAGKTCQYANGCKSDADCNKLSSCEQNGNIFSCKLLSGIQNCSADADCPPTKYCNTLLGSLGECREKSQCHIDADCGNNMVCKVTGEGDSAYNTCTAANPQSCLLDFQCSNNWLCIKNKCTPRYDGMCPAIEGTWNVILSTGTLCMGITAGNQFEFVPKESCTGDVKLTGSANLSFGTFAKQSDSSNTFDIKLLAVLNCTSDVLIGATVMQVNCGSNCSINLAKLP